MVAILKKEFNSFVASPIGMAVKEGNTELLEQAYSDSDREIGKPNYINAIHTIFIQELEFFNSFHKKNICINPNWIPLKNIDLKLVENARHELLNEIDKEDTYNFISTWIEDKIK